MNELIVRSNLYFHVEHDSRGGGVMKDEWTRCVCRA